VTRIDDEQYWLYTAVDPESNELLHTKLEPTRTNALAEIFFGGRRGKQEVVFLVDDATPPKDCHRHGLDFRHERHGNRNRVERVFREVKRRTDSFSDCFSYADPATADDWFRSFAFAWDRRI
jgi:transposase-like protein